MTWKVKDIVRLSKISRKLVLPKLVMNARETIRSFLFTMERKDPTKKDTERIEAFN